MLQCLLICLPLAESTKSLYLYISTHQGREVVTKGGPRQVFMVRNITNNVDDPIFSIPGDIAMNWNYYNNRHRIVLTGGHLSANDSNDENTHGFGNHVCVERKGKSRDQCKFEISNIQDCPFPSCRNVKVQGTDHGSDYKDGPVYGNYAIYLSNNTQRFPTCRRMLMLQMNDGNIFLLLKNLK